ncbi:MAG: right-handed parallel beta-helix repeat-containing protein [Armatimonadota bacterium]
MVSSVLVALLLTGSIAAGEEGEARRVLHVSQRELAGVAAEAQFRTIGEATAKAEAGDTVLIHGGTYRERVTVEKSGTAERPIRFEAAPGEQVVLTGADEIKDWEKADPERAIYRTPWRYDFITHNESRTHPDDEYHIVIGRAEQVFIKGYLLHQVLSPSEMSRGSFYVDLAAKQLYVWGFSDQDLSDDGRVEASTREVIWEVRGSYIQVRELRFRYAANRAQQGAAQFRGDHNVIEDCVFERTNGVGAVFGGEGVVVRNCTFQDNGQLGFAAGYAHNLLMTGCTVRNNNTKDFDRGWEAGGNKIVFTRGAVIEKSVFVENRGHGLWFDIGNEDCEVRNCLFADNEDCGIFYEISYGLHAHDNVFIGNGFADSPGGWGASCGISLSSSPNCVIERNLIVGNREGFNFREQGRSTPRIGEAHEDDDEREDEPIWNHDQVIQNNLFAYNREAQVWGWFDIGDQRHWPAVMQEPAQIEREGGQPAGLTLEKLNITFHDNVYYPAAGQGLFNWGTTWDEMSRRYGELTEVRAQLDIESGGVVVEPGLADIAARDLRVPADSAVLRMGCYPEGEVPGVRLGVSPGS